MLQGQNETALLSIGCGAVGSRDANSEQQAWPVSQACCSISMRDRIDFSLANIPPTP